MMSSLLARVWLQVPPESPCNALHLYFSFFGCCFLTAWLSSFSYSASTKAFKLFKLAVQNVRYCSSQESTAFNGSGLSWYKRCRPSLLSSTRCARRRIPKCFEIAGRDTVNDRAISPAGRTPPRSKSSTARRVGSERALNAKSGVAPPDGLPPGRSFLGPLAPRVFLPEFRAGDVTDR